MHKVLAVLITIAFLSPSVITDAQAGGKYKGKTYSKSYKSTKKRSKVLGYSKQVGGYSFSYYDTLTPVPLPSRNFGPFDSGMFFDSDTLPGNNSPYLY